MHRVWLRGNRVIRWMAGIAVAALLVGGGVALGANLASLTSGNATTRVGVTLASSSAIRSAALGGLSSTGLTGAGRRVDLAGLRTCRAAARQLAESGHHAAAQAKRRACQREFHASGLLLLRRLLFIGGEHGQITLRTKKGSRTVAFERGVIQAASSSSVVIKAADGTTLTWHLISRTAVVRVQQRTKGRTRVGGKNRKNRTIDRVSASALAAGQRVFVVGAVVGGTDSARLIIIRG
ncbi:MAG TPA: hypothetical protein VN695_11955 [Streptosporangiaceae bacterium]|nr:hypothetical protein [Streptosporangiaceae bacterium]